jgi:2-dehydro-3-deoxyphosphogluconate aldolase / (4S)-4-hydroxy-2-oxoglutarate aldolase
MVDQVNTEPLSAREIAGYGPVIPVIVIDDLADAIPLADALLAGGIRVMEVTLRTAAGITAIEMIARQRPEIVVGVGTCRHANDMKLAKAAGAKFCVSPGYLAELGRASRELAIPLLPGVATSTELMLASNDGFNFLKLFPAEAVGGVKLLSAWQSTFRDIAFCPTGGVSPTNAATYLGLKNVLCVGGSWLTSSELMQQKNWSKITQLAREASQIGF